MGKATLTSEFNITHFMLFQSHRTTDSGELMIGSHSVEVVILEGGRDYRIVVVNEMPNCFKF